MDEQTELDIFFIVKYRQRFTIYLDGIVIIIINFKKNIVSYLCDNSKHLGTYIQYLPLFYSQDNLQTENT